MRHRLSVTSAGRWRRRATLIVIVASALLLAACAGENPAAALAESGSDAQATTVALQAVDAALATSAHGDGRDLGVDSVEGTEVSASSFESPRPRVVMRKVDMRRSRELLDFEIDRTTTPATAVVEILLTINGNAEFWYVWPASDARRELAGVKPIALRGRVKLLLERAPGGWRLVDARADEMRQGPRAASVTSWGFEPDPLLPGRPGTLSLTLRPPRPADVFAPEASGAVLGTFGTLRHLGDQRYGSRAQVPRRLQEGASLAFLSALNTSATFNLTVHEDGRFVEPYTETVLPVVARVGWSE